ncbi:GTPase IMAP family member 8-like [Babylonia areolata]|uniref:GTPase IMAP family member 8-like n=1 Tax=Babylonia areolata TaxID=304850 RepID=UPI003FD35F61
MESTPALITFTDDVTEGMTGDTNDVTKTMGATSLAGVSSSKRQTTRLYPSLSVEDISVTTTTTMTQTRCPDADSFLTGKGAQQSQESLQRKRSSSAAVAGSSEPEKSKREYSVLIIGKTGNGKSSLANTITGDKNFPVGASLSSTTREAQVFTANVGRRRLKVIDTPDFINMMADKRTAQRHVDRWKVLTNSLPDVIILTVRCDVRYTKEEHDIYQAIQDRWGDRSVFQKRLMVAFTFGDRQDEDLEEELDMVCEELKSVLKDAKNRFVQVNNRARGEGRMEQLDNICRQLDTVIKQNESEDFSAVIIGKTGHGKSSLGNLITGRQSFEVGIGLSSVTTSITHVSVSVQGKRIKVIDTPDLEPSRIRQQIDEWKEEAHPNPVVILLAVRCDVIYTSEDYSLYTGIKRLWGGDGDSPRVIVVFTFVDRLESDLKQCIRGCPELRSLLKDVGKSYVQVNNRASAVEKRKVLTTLLGLVDDKVSRWPPWKGHKK